MLFGTLPTCHRAALSCLEMDSAAGAIIDIDAAAEPLVKPQAPLPAPETAPLQEPPYHVILHDDDDHTFRYVIVMMEDLFGYDHARGFLIACEVNEKKRAIVVTCHKELAELRVEQIHEYAPEDEPEKPPMKASMEPAA
jgi:ATP-dependent Clp protease adaptor protein ClpS